MKQRRHFDIFSLSFLDVVSCGFGAMVMLILIARPVEGDPRGGVDDTRTLLQTVFAAQEDSRQAQEELHKLRDHISRTQEQLAALARMTQSLEDQAADEKKGLAVLKDKADGLQVVKTSVTSASITPATARKRDLEVGGIPVDSEYVIFIVDTSGSMHTRGR